MAKSIPCNCVMVGIFKNVDEVNEIKYVHMNCYCVLTQAIIGYTTMVHIFVGQNSKLVLMMKP